MSQIVEKIKQFQKELENYKMSEQQRRMFNSFCRTKGAPVVFTTFDRYGEKVKLKLYTDKPNEGTQHILLKHYKSAVGRVTAIEIISMLEVIEKGEKSKANNGILYTLSKNYHGVKYIINVKLTGGGNVLKSFYSDRKK